MFKNLGRTSNSFSLLLIRERERVRFDPYQALECQHYKKEYEKILEKSKDMALTQI